MTELETAPSPPDQQELIPKFIESHKLSHILRYEDGSIYLKSIALSKTSNNKNNDSKSDILYCESPLVLVPPYEFSKLINLGKCCCVCGEIFKFTDPTKSRRTPDPQKEKLNEKISMSRYMQGLDCDICPHKWCSSQCKKIDVFHSLLNHIPSNSSMTNKIVDLEGKKLIINYSKYCEFKKSVLLDNCDLVYYAFFTILQLVYDPSLTHYFDFLPIPILKDAGSETENLDKDDILLEFLNKQYEIQIPWSDYYSLICSIFKQPNLESHEVLQLTFTKFLKIMCQFKLNSIYGEGNSIFLLSSFLKHSCDPNCKISFISDEFTLDDDIDTDYKVEAVVDNSVVFVRKLSVSSEDTKDPLDSTQNKTIGNNGNSKNSKNGKNSNVNSSGNNSKEIKVISNKTLTNVTQLNQWNSKARGIKIHRLREDKEIDGKDVVITVNYLQNAPNDVFQRKSELMKFYNIDCDCHRCEKELQIFRDSKDNQHQSQSLSDSDTIYGQLDALSITSTSPQLSNFVPRRASVTDSSIKKSLLLSPNALLMTGSETTNSIDNSKNQHSMHSSYVKTYNQKRPSFTSSGGSFGEGILKYNRRQIKEMLDTISGSSTRKNDDENLFLDSSDEEGDEDFSVIEEEEEEEEEGEGEAGDATSSHPGVIQLTVPSGFNLSGRRKSVRFDDNLSTTS